MSLDRYFVPDLSPRERPVLHGRSPRVIFVAESPHVSEVTPEGLPERRPLCGKAGQAWWGLLSELLDGRASNDVSLERLLKLCSRHHLVVLNAVQYPLDPKVTAQFPEADPVGTVGFSKAPGATHYKKLKTSSAMRQALESLKTRLDDPELASCPIYCLGLDAEWFVARALGPQEFERRVRGRIPHPSAWWRRGGLYGRIARERLKLVPQIGSSSRRGQE